MMHRIYQYLFKPEYLILNPRGAVHFDCNLNFIGIYQNGDKLCQVLAEKLAQPKFLNIIIDGYDHDYVKIVLPTQHFWQRLSPLKLPATIHDDIHFVLRKNQAVHISSIPYCQTLHDWVTAINANNCGLLSVESIVFGLSCIAITPQLYILPTRFNQLRLIFVNGVGGVFCRFIHHCNPTLPVIEIQRTINYICREFAITAEDIDVISSLPCPVVEPAVKSWQQIPIGPEYCEQYLISLLTVYRGHRNATSKSLFKINRFKIFVGKLFRPVMLAVAVIMTVSNSIDYCDNYNLQRKIDHVYADNHLRQKQYDEFGYDTCLNNYQQLHAENQPYVHARSLIHDPLVLLQQLNFTKVPLPAIIHVIYTKADHLGLYAQLLIEFKVNAGDDHDNDNFDKNIKSYVKFLHTQFKGAVIKIDQNSHIIANNSQFQSLPVVIQISRIKL